MVEQRKRRLSADESVEIPSAKRLRAGTILATSGLDDVRNDAALEMLPSVDELAKNGLRRSVLLVLEQVGFHSASPEALESFTTMAETYLAHLSTDVRRVSNVARRNQPIGPDFEHVLDRYNLTTSALRPHLRPPVPRRKRRPAWDDVDLGPQIARDLPNLGPELSGQAEKRSKAHIPSTFPDFPSVHTYRYTPEVVEAVTVPDIWPDAGDRASSAHNSLLVDARGGKSSQPAATHGANTNGTGRGGQPPLKPDEIPRGDAKKLREALAREARLGEEALRRLQRASKLAKQSELWAAAERDPVRRSKMNLWQDAMRDLMGEEGASGGGGGDADKFGHDGVLQGRVDVADRSMVVNAEAGQLRQIALKGKS